MRDSTPENQLEEGNEGISAEVASGSGRVVTVGTFDGVHTGHCEVLAALKEFADERGLIPTVVTFDRHPLETVAPDRAPRRLQTNEERDALLRARGVDVIEVKFTPEVRSLTAEQWMLRLRDMYGARGLLSGYDNRFGCDGRSLTPADYAAIGKRIGLEVREAGELPGVSSTAVRRAIEGGNIEEAAALLGRPYSVTGIVETGRQIGRTIGFPTANLRITDRIQLPPAGVYAVIAKGHPAVLNIGYNPTVTDRQELRIEAHILDWEGNIYGDPLTLEFVKRLRSEKKFADLNALRSAIDEDVARTRALLS
ncbi:MAG: riboflavin biosynthesis protein RibF [Muribaculaceae bacterium]|nr:riboflavin biosynthesis protein RibF [Muribaculaceae bacterium]